MNICRLSGWDSPARLFVLLCPVLLLASPALAEEDQEDADGQQHTYSFLLRERHATLKANGEKVVRIRQRVQILKPAAVEYLGEIRVPYNSYRVKARFLRGTTLLPDGREIEVDRRAVRAGVSAGMTDYLMYEDVAELSFSMPAVRVGAILDYEYELREHRPAMKGECSDSFVIESHVPVKEARYVLEAPKALALKIVARNAEVRPTEKEGFRTVTRAWAFRDIPAFRYEEGMPSPRESQVAIHVGTLASWRAVQDWYAAIAKDAFALNDAIRAKVGELTAEATGEQEKIRALYLFMQREIRYVGIELGRSAYEPHPAAECFRNRYGDCKDQSVLLVAMLRHLGIEAHLALVRVGEGSVDRELPDVGQFNHVIVHVPRPDGPLWLDSTAKYMDERSHPEELDGVLALVVGGPEGTDFLTIAAPEPERACDRTIYEVELMSGGRALVKEMNEYTGRAGAESRVFYENLVPERRRRWAEGYVHDKGGVLISFGNSSPHDVSAPFREWIVYEAPGFLEPTADGYAVNLSAEELGWTVGLPAVARRPGEDRAVRQRPWASERSFGNGLRYVFRLPPGVRANALPKPYERRLAQGQIRLSASITDGAVIADALVAVVPCRIPPEDYEAHKVRTDRAIGRASITLTFTDDVKRLLNANRPREAREFAASLVARHPESADAHFALASACHDVGRLVQARREYRETLRLAPDRLDAYTRLAMTYGGWRGSFGEGFDRADVLLVARQAAEKARDRRGAQLFLADCLSRNDKGVFRGDDIKDYGEAIAVYEQMLAECPDDLAPLAEIAECHYARGEFAKAEACFNRVLRKEPGNFGARVGQWVCAACLGRTDEAIGAIRTAYDDKEARAQELGRLLGLLMRHRMYGAMLEVFDSRLAILQRRDQSAEAFRDLLARVAKSERVEHGAFFDLGTPASAVTSFFGAFLQQDRERLLRSLSPRLGVEADELDELLAMGGGLRGPRNDIEFRLDVFRSVWTVAESTLPGGIQRLDLSIPKDVAGQLGADSHAKITVLCERDADGAWRICGFGNPELEPWNLSQVALSFLDEGNLQVAKHYADLVRHSFLRKRTLLAEPDPWTELADLAYPDDASFVKAMCAASLHRVRGDDDAAEPRRLRLARELAERMPDCVPVRRLLADHLFAAERYGQALEQRQALAQQLPDDKSLLVQTMANQRRLYRYRDAIATADRLAQLMPDADIAKRVKLDVLSSAGYAEEGRKLLAELRHRMRPDEAREAEIRLHAFSGDRARILALVEEVAKDEDATVALLFPLVLSLRHAGCHQRALDLVESVHRRVPSVATTAELCEQFLFTGDLEEARDAFDRLVAADRLDGTRAHFMACLGVALGRFEQAERIFSEKLKTMDVDSKVYAELFIGVCRVLRGDVPGGREAIARAGTWQHDEIWPKPVLRYFADQADMADLLAAARAAETESQREQFLCETYFYAAIRARMDGNEDKCRLYLRQAADARSYLTMECAIAHGLLGVAAPPDGEQSPTPPAAR